MVLSYMYVIYFPINRCGVEDSVENYQAYLISCCAVMVFESYGILFWKRCFLKTSVSNGIIYTKYTQNPHTIEPPFNIATQSAT